MNKYNAKSALEEMDSDNVITDADAPVQSTIPDIDPWNKMTDPDRDLSEDDKSQLFLFMLKKYLGNDRFAEVVDNMATDMEVYGLIGNAESAKCSACCIRKSAEADRWSKPVMMAALKMAAMDNTPDFQKYHEAELTQKACIDSIMQEYGKDAKYALEKMLQDNQRRSMMMNGQDAKTIQHAISDIAEHI